MHVRSQLSLRSQQKRWPDQRQPRDPEGTKQAPRTRTVSGVRPRPSAPREFPEVLTLAEAAAYLRVPEPDVVHRVRSVAHGDLPTETIAEPVLFDFEVISHLQVQPKPL
jgi:hypothetical protein